MGRRCRSGAGTTEEEEQQRENDGGAQEPPPANCCNNTAMANNSETVDSSVAVFRNTSKLWELVVQGSSVAVSTKASKLGSLWLTTLLVLFSRISTLKSKTQTTADEIFIATFLWNWCSSCMVMLV
ncbi:unnamed protein product [Sphagnum jensenii]|uniref:Uncharacterized protein n=1 Tax=Sphagnum jensenii TaxID=128206 RepID=A0ABP0W0W1_9BRYO